RRATAARVPGRASAPPQGRGVGARRPRLTRALWRSPVESTHVVGTSVKRLDGEPKVTGRPRFAADLQLPNMLHCRLVPSPYAHARVARVDPAAALALPGVVAVLRGDELELPGL